MNGPIPLADFVVRLSEAALGWQSAAGSMPPGQNGPYRDPETPIRNTGHWLFLFAKAHEETGDPAFERAVQLAAAYLVGAEARPAGHTFRHRSKAGKDACNGLIGQAWTVEALVEAATRLEDMAFMDVAADVFLRHPFHEQSGVWESVEVDGRRIGVDPTFNHQLWFAAAGSLIDGPQTPVIRARVERFLDRLPRTLRILEDGLILHPLRLRTNPAGALVRRVKRGYGYLRGVRRPLAQDHRAKLVSKSVGYHAFCTYAFAILRQSIPAHAFWMSDRSRRITSYLLSEDYKRAIAAESIYGFAYNPPGFEVPFSMSVLAQLDSAFLRDESQWWLSEQFARTYDRASGELRLNTDDPVTLTARMYETVRFPPSLWSTLHVPASEADTGGSRSARNGCV